MSDLYWDTWYKAPSEQGKGDFDLSPFYSLGFGFCSFFSGLWCSLWMWPLRFTRARVPCNLLSCLLCFMVRDWTRLLWTSTCSASELLYQLRVLRVCLYMCSEYMVCRRVWRKHYIKKYTVKVFKSKIYICFFIHEAWSISSYWTWKGFWNASIYNVRGKCTCFHLFVIIHRYRANSDPFLQNISRVWRIPIEEYTEEGPGG